MNPATSKTSLVSSHGQSRNSGAWGLGNGMLADTGVSSSDDDSDDERIRPQAARARPPPASSSQQPQGASSSSSSSAAAMQAIAQQLGNVLSPSGSGAHLGPSANDANIKRASWGARAKAVGERPPDSASQNPPSLKLLGLKSAKELMAESPAGQPVMNTPGGMASSPMFAPVPSPSATQARPGMPSSSSSQGSLGNGVARAGPSPPVQQRSPPQGPQHRNGRPPQGSHNPYFPPTNAQAGPPPITGQGQASPYLPVQRGPAGMPAPLASPGLRPAGGPSGGPMPHSPAMANQPLGGPPGQGRPSPMASPAMGPASGGPSRPGFGPGPGPTPMGQNGPSPSAMGARSPMGPGPPQPQGILRTNPGPQPRPQQGGPMGGGPSPQPQQQQGMMPRGPPPSAQGGQVPVGPNGGGSARPNLFRRSLAFMTGQPLPGGPGGTGPAGPGPVPGAGQGPSSQMRMQNRGPNPAQHPGGGQPGVVGGGYPPSSSGDPMGKRRSLFRRSLAWFGGGAGGGPGGPGPSGPAPPPTHAGGPAGGPAPPGARAPPTGPRLVTMEGEKAEKPSISRKSIFLGGGAEGNEWDVDGYGAHFWKRFSSAQRHAQLGKADALNISSETWLRKVRRGHRKLNYMAAIFGLCVIGAIVGIVVWREGRADGAKSDVPPSVQNADFGSTAPGGGPSSASAVPSAAQPTSSTAAAGGGGDGSSDDGSYTSGSGSGSGSDEDDDGGSSKKHHKHHRDDDGRRRRGWRAQQDVNELVGRERGTAMVSMVRMRHHHHHHRQIASGLVRRRASDDAGAGAGAGAASSGLEERDASPAAAVWEVHLDLDDREEERAVVGDAPASGADLVRAREGGRLVR